MISVTSCLELLKSSNAEAPSRGIVGQLAKGTSIYTLGTTLSKLLQLGIQVLLARQLQLSGYGLYNLGLSVIILLQSVALMGLDQAVLRYSALYRNRGQMEFIKGTLLASLILGVAISVIVSAGLIIGAPSISIGMINAPNLAPALQLFALALPFYNVARITGAFAQSHHDILRMTAIQQISQPGLNLLLMAAIFFARGGLLWAVRAFLISTVFSAVVGVCSIRPIFPDFFSSLHVRINYAELLRYTLVLSAIAILYQLFWRAPTLLLGHLAGAGAVGLYSAATTLASPPGFLSLIFAQPLMPMMVDLYEQHNFQELGLLYGTVTRWTQMVVIPSFGFLMLFREQILALFGSDFKGAETILIILGLAWMIYYSKGPVAALMDMTGRQYIDLANLAGVLILSICLGLLWIPRHGATGAGFAISISVFVWSLAEMIEGWVLFRFLPINWHFLQSIFLAGIIFGAAFLFRGHIPVTIEAAIVGGLYIIVFFLFGLTREDRELLQHGIRKLTPY